MLTKERKSRKGRIRAKVFGTGKRPRLVVFRSNKFTSAQIVDDTKGVTLINISTKNLKTKGTKTEAAMAAGVELAKLASAKKIKEVVFDRAGYKYHGRVKALAEGMRSGGIKL